MFLLQGRTWINACAAKDLVPGTSILMDGKFYRLTYVGLGREVKLVGVRSSPSRPFSMQRRRFILDPEDVVLADACCDALT